ncbi:MAG TPA: hypothetical protein VFF89_05665, partial [Sphingobium sp.]|nr:hypothetical protein [Sphingobium sp.]
AATDIESVSAAWGRAGCASAVKAAPAIVNAMILEKRMLFWYPLLRAAAPFRAWPVRPADVIVENPSRPMPTQAKAAVRAWTSLQYSDN